MVLLKEAREHSDVRLVRACQDGDRSAFDELVRRYKDRVYNVVYRFLGNHEDALDVCQEAFVRAYRRLDAFEGRAQVYTWLYSIAANLARNRLRDMGRKGRNKGTSLEAIEERGSGVLPDRNASPRDEAMGHELEAALQGCLEELPEHCRMVFVLRTSEDLSYGEISQVVGCPVGTVKSRLNQARRLLKERLTELAII